MRMQHGSSVMITDGRKALLLKNEGDADYPQLRMIQKWEEASPADRDLKSDAPGRTFSSAGHGMRRSSYDEPDLHAQAEADFAAQMGEFLNDRDDIEDLVIVAPPRTLGELRKHLNRAVTARVSAEIAKDLVKHPIAEIERLIANYSEPA